MYMKTNDDASVSFTRIPNSVLDWLLGSEHGLTYRQQHILHAVFRFTYGFSRRSAPLSSRYLAEYTGIDQAHVCRALKSLVDACLLTVTFQRKIGFYSLCPSKYKNKKNPVVDCADDALSASRCSRGIETDALLASKIKRKEKVKPGREPSSLESKFAALLLSNGLPISEREYQLGRWRFDFAWPEQKVAVEIDGGTFSGGSHVSGEGHERDCLKQNYAVSQGWVVFRLNGRMMDTQEGRDTVLDSLRERGVTGSLEQRESVSVSKDFPGLW